jgi:hypothetical protein
MKRTQRQLRNECCHLAYKLSQIAWISHGYVQDRGPGAGGPCYQWTRKEKKKTISVALSKEQYEAMKTAIANWRTTQRILRRMEVLSRKMIFQTLPDTRRRKPLSSKVIGTN